MSKVHVQFQAVVALTRTVEYLPVGGRFFCVRVTNSGAMQEGSKVNERRFSSYLQESHEHMLVTEANLKKFLDGKAYATEDLVHASEAFLESARTKGYVRACELHQKEFEHNNNAKLFERLENGEKVNLIRFDYASHMLFDAEGDVLPTGLLYDYMTGNMRNGAYDLHKAAAFLRDNAAISTIKGKKLEVQSVPYYNVSAGCSESLDFVFAPTTEQMRAMWNKAKEVNKKYPSCELHRAVFELDMLGLRKAKIALGKDFYYSESYDEEEDHDEDDNI